MAVRCRCETLSPQKSEPAAHVSAHRPQVGGGYREQGAPHAHSQGEQPGSLHIPPEWQDAGGQASWASFPRARRPPSLPPSCPRVRARHPPACAGTIGLPSRLHSEAEFAELCLGNLSAVGGGVLIGGKEQIMPNKSFPRSQTPAGEGGGAHSRTRGLHPSPGPDSHITIYMDPSIVLIRAGVNSSVGRGQPGAHSLPPPRLGSTDSLGTGGGGKFPTGTRQRARGSQAAAPRCPSQPGHRVTTHSLLQAWRLQAPRVHQTRSVPLFNGQRAPPALLHSPG